MRQADSLIIAFILGSVFGLSWQIHVNHRQNQENTALLLKIAEAHHIHDTKASPLAVTCSDGIDHWPAHADGVCYDVDRPRIAITSEGAPMPDGVRTWVEFR